MAEAFKHLMNAKQVQAIGRHLARVWSGFDRAGFTTQALGGLEAGELKARVMQIAHALVAVLPADADQAVGVLEASLGPPGEGDDLASLRTSDAGVAGWPVWPLTEAVALIAAERHPARGLRALQAMTQRFSAEFAIRPFIVHHPALSLATLAHWVDDPSAHVRRLVSEGSRPRLPWGLRLQALVADPAPTLPLLRRLQDDPSAYVRRSVANHLNDIAKDHPDLIAHWLAEHLPEASTERRALLRHASRGLIKQGDSAVLAAWGLGQPFAGQATLRLSPAHIRLGDSLLLQITLHSSARQTQRLAIDYAVHHVKAAGHRTAKVFKGWLIELAPGETRALQKLHPMRLITTRTYHPGAHALDLRINGQVLAEQPFELLTSTRVKAR